MGQPPLPGGDIGQCEATHSLLVASTCTLVGLPPYRSFKGSSHYSRLLKDVLYVLYKTNNLYCSMQCFGITAKGATISRKIITLLINKKAGNIII